MPLGIIIAGAVILAALAASAFARRRRTTGTRAPVASPSKATGGDAIDAFRTWWQSAQGPLAKAIADRKLDAWVDPLTERVRAISPGLQPPGSAAHHGLVPHP